MNPQLRWKSLRADRDFWLLGLILCATFLLYLGSLPKDFTNWDDGEYVVNNPLIRTFSLAKLNKILSEPYFANYAPVTLISYAVDFHFWKLNATGYHLHNVILHLACTTSLFFLLKQLDLSRGVIFATTCLFAIHPVNVESVAWISERKNLLAAFFFFLSFYEYIRYTASRTRLNYLSSFLFFLLSILSKASTVLTPLAFLAYDYFRRGRRFRELHLYDKLPFIVFGEILTFISINAAGSSNALNSYHKGGPLLSLFASGNLITQYLKLLLWPLNLSALYYPRQAPSWENPYYWLTLFIIIGGAIILYSKSKHHFFWFSFFAIFLIPVLNIIPLPIMIANRYLYIPQIGIWVVLSSLILALIGLLQPYKLVKGTVLVAVSFWALFLADQTIQFTRVWKNSYTLWSDVIEKDFYNEIAHYNLGFWFYDHKLVSRAGHEYLTALSINPNYHLALSGMGGYYFERGETDLAIKSFYAAINASPDFDTAINNLGKLLAEKGEALRALYMFYRAAYINPKNVGALNNIVVLYLKVNKPDAALEVAKIIIERFPESSDGYFKFGLCLETKGNLQGALQAWEESKRRVDTQNDLGNELMKQIEAKMIAAREKLSLRTRTSQNSHGS
jgi:protein O-mannosyl-transferase